MANVFNGNTYFIDSAGVLSGRFNVWHIIVQGRGGAGNLVLQDPVTGETKMDLAVASGETLPIILHDISMLFPNGINVTTATNVRATIVVERKAG